MRTSMIAKFKQLAFVVLLSARHCIAQSNGAIFLTTNSQCIIIYERTLAPNATSTPTDQLSTISTTVTSGASIAKTVVFTPRPYITTEDVTSSLWIVTSKSRGNLPTTYTSTVTEETVHYGTSTTTTTVNETISLATTTMLSALPGFTALAARPFYDQVKQKLVAETEEGWTLEDEYWNPYEAEIYRIVAFNRGNYPTAVVCYTTVWTADFHSTVTLRRDIPRQTLTRTRYVDTVTATKTVFVYPTPTNPQNCSTVSTDYTFTSTFSTHIMSIMTSTKTSTIELYPYTSTAYAACATDNVINAIAGQEMDGNLTFALDGLSLLGSSNSSRFEISSPNAASALDCCAFAATEPNAWFYSYQRGICTVWIGNTCPSGRNESRGSAHLWWFQRSLGDFWRDDGLVVGNGPCGGIDQISPYFRRH